jgi:tryptophanyl-tRNA synthetase
MSAGVTNLFSLLDASGMHEAHASLMQDYEQGTLKYADLKHEVANGLVAISGDIRERLTELKSDRKAVKNQVKQSSYEIRKRAQETIKEVKDVTGLMNVRF